ncbi:MAG: SDR family NAD(P)-dependent oxidoreductase, partial [Alphaproteobacteria bacterium]|nr:SDR family NAD(P)-dependent oxidoreductase [Alphaproteobacteria bacterium]
MRTHIKKNIWIIGASTGIGRALALELDRQGANLILSARNAAQLNLVNNELENRHHVIPLDVTDVTSLAAAADSLQNLLTPLDSVIFMAGAYQPMRFDKIDLTTRDHIIATNLTGALNTVHVVLPLLRAQKHGQIALC